MAERESAVDDENPRTGVDPGRQALSGDDLFASPTPSAEQPATSAAVSDAADDTAAHDPESPARHEPEPAAEAQQEAPEPGAAESGAESAADPAPVSPAAGGTGAAAEGRSEAAAAWAGSVPASPAAAADEPAGRAGVTPAADGDETPAVRAGEAPAAPVRKAAGGPAGAAPVDEVALPAHEGAAGGPAAAAAGTSGAAAAGSWFRADSEATTVLPAVPSTPGKSAPAGTSDSAGNSAPVSAPAGKSAPVSAPAAAAATPSVDPATVRMPAARDRPTQVIAAATAAGSAEAASGPSADSPPPASPKGEDGDGPKGPDGSDETSTRRRGRRPLLVAAAVVGLLAVLYVLDLVLGAGNMPRGVSVAGQHVGGLSHEEAETQLRAAIDPRVRQPVVVTAGEVRTEVDPVAAGLGVDWAATIERAGAQPLNPVTRITSFFTDRDFDVVSSADDRAIGAALEGLAPLVDKEPTEGTVRFDGVNPVPVLPQDGHRLDVAAAVPVVATQWARGGPVDLPLAVLHPTTTADDVSQVVDSVARPAVSAPVTVTGEGAQGTLAPAAIAKALTFRADAAATPRLVPELNPDVVSDALSPQLASTEKPGRDATLDVSGATPVVVPSQDGRGIDYPATLQKMLPVLTAPAPRQVAAVYGDKPAKVTTEDIQKLGIAAEISTFTTGGFAADSGRNIKRAAEQIDGTIVKPGETFSLNKATNPRNAANGYVEAGIIEDGHPARGVGGGVSQVATTLYNAAYFAGMVDVAHREHSFYISRYPVAREATVFDDVIDVKFRNDGPTGVLIKTIWTPSSLTVKMFGTKRYEVTSTTGPRTNPVPPSPVTIPAGQPCSPSQGAPGFTATDTRTLRNVQTGEVRTEKRTVHYNPSPIVVCGG